MSDYFEQHSIMNTYDSHKSWSILSGIEQRIKWKIEEAGTPLKDWDVQINRGILTGFNEAFIISGKRKDELIKQDPRSAEIIRPILRGRDIKRYGYQFADQYLICTFPSRNYDIDDFPAIKKHLMTFGYERLEQSGKTSIVNGEKIIARKKTNNKWFETQDSISYWDDFSKRKMLWKRIGSMLRFALDETGKMGLDSTCIAIGNSVEFICAVLNTTMGNYLFKDSPKTGTGDLIVSVQAMEPILIPKITTESQSPFIHSLHGIITCQNDKNNYSQIERELEDMVYSLFGITQLEREYIETTVFNLFR